MVSSCDGVHHSRRHGADAMKLVIAAQPIATGR
jgi:hypothetical protein